MDQVTTITPVGCIGNRGVDKDALIRAIDETQPHVLAMDAGSMDCGPWYLGAGKAHSPTLDILWDLEHILGESVPRGIPVIIGTVPPLNDDGFRIRGIENIPRLNDIIREEAKAERVPVADHDRAFGSNEGLQGPDGLHPNDAGYEVLAQTWLEQILELVDDMST